MSLLRIYRAFLLSLIQIGESINWEIVRIFFTILGLFGVYIASTTYFQHPGKGALTLIIVVVTFLFTKKLIANYKLLTQEENRNKQEFWNRIER